MLSVWNNTLLQVLAGVVVVVLVYHMCLWILQRDQLVSAINDATDAWQDTLVLDGWVDAASVGDRTWSTINPYAYNYVPISRSFNRKGGAQFTYAFWLRLSDVSPANVAGKTLLLRGDKRAFSWVRSQQKPPGMEDSAGPNPVNETVTDVLVKCPRIRFGERFDDLVVEFNTLADPDARVRITSDPDPYSDATLRHNLLSLIPTKWVLMTFTFEDNVAIDDFEDGIIVRFYLNDTLYQTSRLRSALRLNQGDLCVAPTSLGADGSGGGSPPLASARLGDVRYLNYALQLEDVRKLFKQGPPTKPASLGDRYASEPLYLSEYNKLDVYNSSFSGRSAPAKP
jgi:hypothetical protein